jgi:hypothetical protein
MRFLDGESIIYLYFTDTNYKKAWNWDEIIAIVFFIAKKMILYMRWKSLQFCGASVLSVEKNTRAQPFDHIEKYMEAQKINKWWRSTQ